MSLEKLSEEMKTLQDYEDAAVRTDVTTKVIADYLQPISDALDQLSDDWPMLARVASDRLVELSHRLMLWYTTLGMVGEAGEIANKIKKVLRDGKYDPLDLAKEDGDVLWYVTRFAQTMAFNLSQVAALNIEKLNDRKEKGTLKGEGDNR